MCQGQESSRTWPEATDTVHPTGFGWILGYSDAPQFQWSTSEKQRPTKTSAVEGEKGDAPRGVFSWGGKTSEKRLYYERPPGKGAGLAAKKKKKKKRRKVSR